MFLQTEELAQEPTTNEVAATGEPPQQEAIKEDWVEVQRKKKVLKNETKVMIFACSRVEVLFRIVISMCIYIVLYTAHLLPAEWWYNL